MVEFERQAGNSEGGDAHRALTSLSSEASQEFKNLVLDWLYRQDEVEVLATFKSQPLEELMELCLTWSSYQMAAQIDRIRARRYFKWVN